MILFKSFKNLKLAVLFISILPAMTLIGSSVANSTIIIIDLIFLYEIYKTKKYNILNNEFFYGLIFLWFILLINLLFFSINLENSFLRSFGFIRFILLVFALKYYLFDNHKNYSNFIFNVWLAIFTLISFDVLFEFINGSNILGFKSSIPGRLVSFLDQEYKIGYIFSFLSLISFIIIFSRYKNSKYGFLKFIYYIICIILSL